MQLRDQSDELQSEIERREKTGDVRGAEAYKQQLNQTQQMLMEKNKLRSGGVFFCVQFITVVIFLCSHPLPVFYSILQLLSIALKKLHS